MIEEDKPVHVPTVPGKYDIHGDKSGRFMSKDGSSTIGSEDVKSSTDVRDELDLKSFADMKLDDDLLDLESFADMKVDEDLLDLESGETTQEELDKIAASSTTLRNYKEAREKAKKKLSDTKMDSKAEELYAEKMREILDHSSPASRFKDEIFLALITSGKYMNQFEAGSSCGAPCMKSPDGGSRGEASHFMFGTKNMGSTKEEKFKWEKYGLLYDSGDLGSFLLPDGDYPSYGTAAGGEWYGKCTVLWNKEKLKGRLTYTLSDSLGRGMAAQRIEEVPDQYTIKESRRRRFTPDSISRLKNIYDVRRLVDGEDWYVEAQFHVDDFNLVEYADAITIPYKTLRGYYEDDIIKGIQLAQKKYPNIKFLTRDKRNKIREISVDDSGKVIYGDVRDDYK